MMTTKKITMDMLNRGITPRIDAVQNDVNSRCVEIQLTRGGETWQPEGLTPAVAFRKPDGTSGLYDTLPDGSAAGAFGEDGSVTVTLAPQVLTCPGRVMAALVLMDENLNRVSTFPFEIHVEPDPSAGKHISNDYYNVTTLAQLNTAMEQLRKELQAGTIKNAELSPYGDLVLEFSDGSFTYLEGMTAYGIARQNGFEGTEAQWLESLRSGADVTLTAEAFVEGKYIYGSTGNETSFSSWNASEYIDISRYRGMGCVIRCYMRDYAGFAFYDDNKVYIEGVHGSAAGSVDPWWMDYATVIPHNAAYIRYTVRPADGDNGSITVKMKTEYLLDRLDRLDASAEDLQQKVDEASGNAAVTITAQDFTAGKYIYGRDGREVTYTAWSASEYVDVSAYQGRSCTVRCYMRDFAGFAFYNENKVYISGVDGTAAGSADPWWMDYTTVIPQNAAYIRYTVRTADNDSGSVSVEVDVQYLAGKIATLEAGAAKGRVPYAYALTKVLCIGDSLTNGAYYASDRTDLQVGITQDYPQVLSRMLNTEVTNAGVNGAKASTWWANHAEKYDFSQYDSFIVWLGTNAGFTDTLDTDVTPYGESYADFAETETGYLCRIVQKIRTDNASCLIAIGTIFASNDDVAVSNTVIRKVAEKYGLTVIDFSDLTAAAYPQLHNGLSNCHFNKAGNIYIAHRIVETINEALNADPMGCEFGMTAQ